MSNYKVKVKNEAESKEVQELFFELGFTWFGGCKKYQRYINTFISIINNVVCVGDGSYVDKELTIPQLRDMVVLKRNDVNDRNVIDPEDDANLYLGSSGNLFVFHIPSQKWKESNLNGEEEVIARLKPISKTMQEYLVKENGQYMLHAGGIMPSGAIVVPEGADTATIDSADNIYFWKDAENKTYVDGEGWSICDDKGFTFLKTYIEHDDASIIWQRHTQPEELLFVDDEPKSLNDTYAEIEQVRQDNVNHPSHYASGDIECIDAIESSMTPEAFKGYLKGNVQKYMWRYEHKGGKESLEKAQWYLNKLISRM